MQYKILLILLLIFTLNVNAQVEEPPIEAPLQQQNVDTDIKSKTQLGVKFNLGFHRFTGTEFNNTKLKFGFGVGFYHIIDLNKKKTLKLHYELNANSKGSKFGKVNDTGFSKMSLLYGELPVFLEIKLSNTPKKQPLYLLVGGQFGVMFAATVSRGFGQVSPVKYSNLPFKKIDVMQAIGIRKDIGSGMSLQFLFKRGIYNINSSSLTSGTPGTRYPDLVPAMTGKGTIYNYTFEIGLMF